MSNKLRSTLRLIAVILVAVCTLMEFEVIAIKALAGQVFWMMVVAFGLVLLASK